MSKLKYKGYAGTIEPSIEDGCLHGEILFINDLITYEGTTVAEIKASFEEAVDRYLAYCEETGRPADKPCSGTFNVRVGPELHRKAVEAAYEQGFTLNEFVTRSIQAATEQNRILTLEHTHHHEITFFTSQTSSSVVAAMEQPHAWEPINATVN
jgi:predicted HicB family RNase H-like nuclease